MLTDPRPDTVEYPTSDGEPMAETDVHRKQMIGLIQALEDYFRPRSDVYVTGNLLMMYQEGDGRKHLAPDVMVVLGVRHQDRQNYKIWEEGKAPDVVIEVTSESTRERDLGTKMTLYAQNQVKEYFIFDPLQEYLSPPLQGYRLVRGVYVKMAGRVMVSKLLGLHLRVEDGVLRLFDPVTHSFLPVHDELVNKWLAAEAARQAAEAACQAAEAAALSGKAEGKLAGKQEVARKMVEQGADSAFILQVTGLTPDQYGS